jgi:heme exporter protein C
MHRFANPSKFVVLARVLQPWVLALAVLSIAWGCYAGLALAPADYIQGNTSRILYIHVPAAWLGMGGWMGLAVCALVQLVWRHPLAGIAARAIAIPGMLFTFLCLATGSIWGRPTWGTWWEWDGRLTSMLVLLFLYAGFLAIDASRSEATEQGSISRQSAIYAIAGTAILPVINRSVVWWESLHQTASITIKGSSIDATMLWPLWFTLIGFSAFFAVIVLMRMRTAIAINKVRARMQRLARLG